MHVQQVTGPIKYTNLILMFQYRKFIGELPELLSRPSLIHSDDVIGEWPRLGLEVKHHVESLGRNIYDSLLCAWPTKNSEFNFR